MPNKTLTLALDGEVPLAQFITAIGHLGGLVVALSKEIRPYSNIEWVVEDLVGGSALATIRGESPESGAVETISAAYLAVGRALASGRPIPYSERVTKEANGITSVLNGKISSVRFETEEDDATISSASGPQRDVSLVSSYGAVEGRVQTLSSRASLRFTLYDAIHDRAVSCYLEPGRQDIMRPAWDRRAVVEGWVSRDARSGRPISIRRIKNVTLIEDVVPGAAIRAARGIAPVLAGGPSAVEAIRRLRDA